ncbi:MAG: hypothetical protein ACK51L_04090 [bacterium]
MVSSAPPPNVHRDFIKKYISLRLRLDMSSLNSSPVDTNALNGSFHCAAGIYCLLPLVNYADSCHRCFFCKGTLHGPCGVLHDPDNITYQNRCNLCDNKYFSNKRIHSNQTALLTPPPVNVMTHLARSTTQMNLMSSVEVMNSEDLILKISDNSTRAPTPTSTSQSSLPETLYDSLIVSAASKESADDSTPIHDWYNLQINEILDQLKPRTKQGQLMQRAWCKCAVDGTGKPLTSIGLVANRLLKILTGKKFNPDTPLNSKLQSKKAERQQQLQHFLGIRESPAVLMIVRKFLSENIMLPVNADGSVIDVDCININTGARVIMLAVEPDSYLALNDISAAPSKESRRAHIDNDALSFNEK